jgi:hypothetical protein
VPAGGGARLGVAEELPPALPAVSHSKMQFWARFRPWRGNIILACIGLACMHVGMPWRSIVTGRLLQMSWEMHGRKRIHKVSQASSLERGLHAMLATAPMSWAHCVFFEVQRTSSRLCC